LDLVAEAPAEADPLADLVKSATDNTASTETVQETTAAPVTGEYAVQFGAPAVEADANGLAKRVKTEFAEQIDGRDVLVIKAESNGKTVYRVRAVGYTRDEANAACSGVTSAGGKCFIARN
jgi:Tfp pilus assembly protein PilX